MPVEPALGRRAIAAGLLAAALPLRHARAAGLPVPPSNRLTFRVMRKGSDIGSHALVFVARPGMLVITSAGCNVLDYALLAPKRIHAVDANPRQTALAMGASTLRI